MKYVYMVYIHCFNCSIHCHIHCNLGKQDQPSTLTHIYRHTHKPLKAFEKDAMTRATLIHPEPPPNLLFKASPKIKVGRLTRKFTVVDPPLLELGVVLPVVFDGGAAGMGEPGSLGDRGQGHRDGHWDVGHVHAHAGTAAQARIGRGRGVPHRVLQRGTGWGGVGGSWQQWSLEGDG